MYAREPVRFNARDENDRVCAAFGQALHDVPHRHWGGKQNPYAGTAVPGKTARFLARMRVSVRGESYSGGYGVWISNMQKWQQVGEKRCGQTSGKDA